ncbi:MAG: type II secretion system F family protein [Candidatus Bathyarchaeia archaeon]|jgi:flagellar protein FlaJ
MKNNRPLERIRAFCSRLRTRFKLSFGKSAEAKRDVAQEKPGFSLESPQSIAYGLLGNRTGWVLPLFKDLDVNLRKSGLKVNFKVYVSLTIFATLLVCAATLALIPCLLFLVFNLPLLPAVLFGVGGCLFAYVFSTLIFYSYPIYRADTLRRGLEDELSFTTGYMAILASAGVSPERMFYSLSSLSVPLAVTPEAKDVIRDVNLFGSDIISALEETSKRTPSQTFRETIEGFIATIHSGGNLAAYLRQKSKEYMRLKRISLKKYSDDLSMLSEVYVTLLLTGPLFLVIMLVVMAMLGGGGFGILSPDLMLELLTYVGIPLGAIAFLVILDAMSPKW